MPVVMVSSLTEQGAEATLSALQYGAVDFFAKPKVDLQAGLLTFAGELTDKVKAAAKARVKAFSPLAAAAPVTKATGLQTTDRVIAIAASTGGTEAIADMLKTMPPDAPGMVIAQHIPPVFSAHFAARLNRACALTVREAHDGAPLLAGHVYVAPGGRHLRVERSGLKYFCSLGDDDPVNRHRPSCDVLFDSVAKNVGRNAVGVILTGMGADGAGGLLRLREAGGFTLAQDQDSSVVWGMPGEAVRRGAACEVLPVDKLTARTLLAVREIR
jgi:two-component system chemotaxis response regulator CheB